jgi:hypothetical protein
MSDEKGKRVALVIGNASYTHAVTLKNPTNDATAMADTLQRFGFEVIGGSINGTDLPYGAFRERLRDFGRALRDRNADVALLFFAGHGMQVNGRNYLVPVDAAPESEADVDLELIELQTILNGMAKSQRTCLVFLDACRDNPLARNLARAMRLDDARSAGITEGLVEQKVSAGTLIGFATQPEHVAYDGAGDNGYFTEALLKQLQQNADRDVELLLRDVRNKVIEDTEKKSRGSQVPWVHSALTGEFRFGLSKNEARLTLAKPHLPEPRRKALDDGSNLAIARNRVGSRAAGPRRRPLPINSEWRDWFNKREVCLGAALSQWFTPPTEKLTSLEARLIAERGKQRDWLVCSRERIYSVLDRPNLFEPKVEWSAPLDCDENRNPRIAIGLISSDNDYSLTISGHQVIVSRQCFPQGQPTRELSRWVIKLASQREPSRDAVQATSFDCDVLNGLRQFLDRYQHVLSEQLLENLRSHISDHAALAAMYLVRMHRRHLWLKKNDVTRLRPVLEDGLCRRTHDPARHRYFAQFAYLLWCDTPKEQRLRAELLSKAIKLRDRSSEKKEYPGYEAMRAVSRILCDEEFLAEEPSSKDLSNEVKRDLKAAKSLIREDFLSEDHRKNLKKWLKLNKIDDSEFFT